MPERRTGRKGQRSWPGDVGGEAENLGPLRDPFATRGRSYRDPCMALLCAVWSGFVSALSLPPELMRRLPPDLTWLVIIFIAVALITGVKSRWP